MKSDRYSAGLSLVSMLIGLALGVALLFVLVELLLVSRASLRWQATASAVERAGERALRLVAAELATAGFRSGVDIAPAVAAGPGCAAQDGWAVRLRPALMFADRGSSDAALLSDASQPGCLPVRYLQPGSDLLALRRAATVPSGNPASTLMRRFRETQWYLLARKSGDGAFLYAGEESGPPAVPPDAVAREWRSAIFYVRDYSVRPGDRVPTLCVERLSGSAMRSECLVEGISRLHLEFSLDEDHDGRFDDVVATPSAAQLLEARSAAIYLHVRSVEALRPAPEAKTLFLGSEQLRIPAGDGHLHRVFLRTVQLANAP